MVEKKLEDMSVKELRVEAKARGFKKVSKLSKGLLLEALGHVASISTAPPSPMDEPVITPHASEKPTDLVPTEPIKRTRRAPTKETVGAIESGVPIPSAPAKAKYPLEALKSGETFLVTCPAKDAKKIRLNIMNAARRITKKTGAAFLVLVWDQEKGVRCWRTDYVEPIKVPRFDSTKAAEEMRDKVVSPELIEPAKEKEKVKDESPNIADTPAPITPPEAPASEFKLFND